MLSYVQLFETLWTTAHQALLAMVILQARTLEWVAMPFSRESSPSSNWTWVSCVTGGFFTVWVTDRLTVLLIKRAFPGGSSGKESPCQCRNNRMHVFVPLGSILWRLVEKIPWRRKWQPTPVFLENPITEEPDGLQFMGLQRVGITEHPCTTHTHTVIKSWKIICPVVLYRHYTYYQI